MTGQAADKIIAAYKPHEGFFDLSIKPDGLDKMTYAKILNAQNFIVQQNANREYLKKHEPVAWEKTKEFSAELQQIIFRYWGDSIFT